MDGRRARPLREARLREPCGDNSLRRDGRIGRSREQRTSEAEDVPAARRRSRRAADEAGPPADREPPPLPSAEVADLHRARPTRISVLTDAGCSVSTHHRTHGNAGSRSSAAPLPRCRARLPRRGHDSRRARLRRSSRHGRRPGRVAAAIAGSVAVALGPWDGALVALGGAVVFGLVGGWGDGALAALVIWPAIVIPVGFFGRRVADQRVALRRLVVAGARTPAARGRAPRRGSAVARGGTDGAPAGSRARRSAEQADAGGPS